MGSIVRLDRVKKLQKLPSRGVPSSRGQAEHKKTKIYKKFIRGLLQYAPSDFGAGASCARAQERKNMDAVYLLMLLGLYAVTHALIWGMHRLSKTP